MRKIWFSAAAMAVVLQAHGPAFAQDAPAAGGVDEVTVTAQKRTERLMSVPISITALSGEAVAESGARNLVELQGIAPGIYFSGNTGYSVAPISIRGTSGTSNFLGEEPVAIYVDGVFQNAGTSGTVDFLDLRSVEVVRGPQGTLQGRNSTAGALLMTTQNPESTFGGYVRASIADPGEYRIQAAVTGPLGENLAGRLAIGGVDELGWARNTFNNSRLGGQSSRELRGTLLWSPANTTVRLVAGKSTSSATTAIARWANTTFLPTGQAVILGVNATPTTPLPVAQQNLVLDDFYFALNTQPRADTLNSYATLEINREIGDLQLVSITGFGDLKIKGQADSDGIAATDRYGFNVNRQTLKSRSQELRLQSSSSQRLSWILGGYASRSVGTQKIDLFNLTLSTGRNQYLESIAHQVDTTTAAFADATFKLTDQLSFIAGTRYTSETKNFERTSGFYALNGTLFPAPPFSAYAPPKAKFHDTSWRAKAVYAPNSNVLLYASYSRGFKAGGFNALGNDPAFEPETLTSAEVGAKVTLLDRRLSLSGSAYRNDYNNLQVTAGVPAGGVAIYNAARADISGGEVEAQFRLTPNLSINANVAYTDAQFSSFPRAQDIFGAIVNAKGNRLPRSPEWQYFIQPTYDFAIGDWTGSAQVTWRWRDKVYFFFTNQDAPNLQSPSNGELGARVNLTRPQSGLTLSAFGTNLTNERVVSNEQSLFNYPVASFNKPRVIGLEVKQTF